MKKTISVKVHDTPQGRIVAACDSELLGKKYSDNGRVLDLDRYRAFYSGRECSETELLELIKTFASLNLVGGRATGVAVGSGIVGEGSVIKIAGIPHVQAYRI
jgi:hypothetical protein